MANDMKYVQLEPGAFIGDIDFQVMTDRQRGIYLSLILYLYSSGGTLPNTVQTLFKLCSSTLENFEEDWEAIKHKFIVNDTISHKRVDEEIERATAFFNKKRLAGIKSGESRREKAKAEQCSSSVRTHLELSKVK